MIPATEAKVEAQLERNCNVESKLNELIAESNQTQYSAPNCTLTAPQTP